MTPGEAKRAGRTILLREDWNEVRLIIMLQLLRQKFRQPKLGKMLLDTGSDYIVEGNQWHDSFWGVCSCQKCKDIQGQNNLGRLLMQVRSEIAQPSGRSNDQTTNT